MARMAAGEYSLVYVAPERLVFPGFRGLLRNMEIPLVAIDEAHCISEWGHDFRPEYLEIGGLLADLPDGARARLHGHRDAGGARRDPEPPRPARGHAAARPRLRAAEPAAARGRGRGRATSGTRRSTPCSAEALGGPGKAQGVAIVYAPTRRGAEEEGGAARPPRLARRRLPRRPGGGARGRRRSARSSKARTEIMVATNAFGMGIDRAGRARGRAPRARRDRSRPTTRRSAAPAATARSPAGLLLVSPNDMPLRRRLLEGDARSEAVLAHKWGLFLELMRWAEGGSCRHDAILRYFGDEAETLDGCGRCDVCEALHGEDPNAEDVTLVVRKALSAVARVHRQFGLQARGEAAARRGRPAAWRATASTARRPSARCASTPSAGCCACCAAASPRAGWTSPAATGRWSSSPRPGAR